MHINNFFYQRKNIKKKIVSYVGELIISHLYQRKNKEKKYLHELSLDDSIFVWDSGSLMSVQLSLPKHKQKNLSFSLKSQQLNKEKLKTQDPKISILNLRLLYSLLETFPFSPFKFSVAA